MQDKSDSDIADISCTMPAGCGGVSVDDVVTGRAPEREREGTAPQPIGAFAGVDFDEAMAHPSAMRKSIYLLAWPVIAELVLQTVTQMADMIMVGRLGAACVAAVGLSNQPLNIAQGFFMGISVGTTALVARFVGAGDRKRADMVTAQSLVLGTILAAILGTIGFLATPRLVRFMKAGADVIPYGESYMRTLMPGLFMLVINMIASAALRGAGDTKYPMKVNIFLNLFNLLGNYAFIYGNFGFPAMGVTGAALATTIARGVGTSMLLWHVFSGRGVVAVRTHQRFRFDWDMIGRVVRIGLPASLERVSLSLGLAFYVRIVSALGTSAYAAHAIAINAEGISYMPGFAFAVSATTIVGQALGAGRPDVAERAGWQSWKMSATVMGLMGAVLFFFPGILMRLYVDDPEIIGLGAGVLRIMACAQIPMSAAYVFMGALRGAGDTKAVLYVAMTSVWLVRFSLAALFVNVFGWGLVGAWYAMALDWVVRGSVSMARFAGSKWKEMTV